MDKNKFPKIYAFDEKYGEWYVQVDTEEEENKLWIWLLNERLKEGFYSFCTTLEQKGIKQIIKENNYKEAEEFLMEQRENEYEDFHTIDISKLSDLIK